MTFKQELRNLLKNKLVIRHRASGEDEGSEGGCCICARKIRMAPGNLCIAVGDEGILCRVCAGLYAPEMAGKIDDQLPLNEENGTDAPASEKDSSLTVEQWSELTAAIDSLRTVSTDLAKGIARGIVEAPAGHIGLLHYAKDIQKPPLRENESEKEYALRVRTHRMTKLYEIISGETVGRINRIKAYLEQLGLPDKLS